MKLNDDSISNTAQWVSKGFAMPRFDRARVRENTREKPVWLHLGAGNIFRSFVAALQQNLLNKGLQDRGIIVAEGYDHEIIDAAFSPYDDLSVSVVLKADGNIEKTVIASVVESVKMDDRGLLRLKDIFAAESLQLLTLTITEKGYALSQSGGAILSDVAADFANGPGAPVSYMGKLASLCYHRYKNCAAPLALVSMDNCSHNGTRLFEAIHSFASGWVKNDLVESGFLRYTEDPERLSFPWTMVDKITPRPDDDVAVLLSETGLEDMQCTTTAKGTYISPYVNAEESEYLVVEDAFPNGRPPLEKAGVIITDRETVDKVEKMKVCTCLNPLHTGLAVFGCLLDYKRISDAMKDGLLKKLVCRIANEGLRVVVDPKIISPYEFVDEVINVRLPNPFIPDTPQRIATDTSLKIPIRFGETLKAYVGDNKLDVETLRAIPLVLAGWLRYLLGVDDYGNIYELSPDLMLTGGSAASFFFAAGGGEVYLLSNTAIFGVDLFEVGIAGRVADYFEMMKGPGAVRRTLESVLS